MRSVVATALWEQRRSVPGWCAALASLILLEAALWPSIRSMPSLETYLAEFPPALKEAFGIDNMSTGQGFLNAELFSLMLPLLFIAFGVSRGASMIAGEEEAGRLELLLVTPLSATRLFVESLLALLAALAGLAATVFISTMIGSLVFDLNIHPGAAAAGSLAVFGLGAEFGVIALVAGAMSGRRSVAIAIPALLALLTYVLYIAAAFVDGLTAWQAWSPFEQALHAGPLDTALPPSFLWLGVVPIACAAGALPLWARRDI